MLNPVFSIAHMREMGALSRRRDYFVINMYMPKVPIFYDVTHRVSALISFSYACTLYGCRSAMPSLIKSRMGLKR